MKVVTWEFRNGKHKSMTNLGVKLHVIRVAWELPAARVCMRVSSTLMSWSNENKSCMRVDKREFAWEFHQLSCPGQTRTRVAWELTSESLHGSFINSHVLIKREQELHESWQARVCEGWQEHESWICISVLYSETKFRCKANRRKTSLEQTPRTTIVQTQSITTNLSGTTHQTVLWEIFSRLGNNCVKTFTVKLISPEQMSLYPVCSLQLRKTNNFKATMSYVKITM